MKNTLTVISTLVLLISPKIRCEEPDNKWDTDVLGLFSLQERDASMQRLLSRGLYPASPKYKETEVGVVKEVVLCPQREGRPLVTVFARTKLDPEDSTTRSGHMIVLRNDGTILPVYSGANVLKGHMDDLNGDGIMDYISIFGIGHESGTITGLHIVPVTEAFAPTLTVYWPIATLDWKLHQPDPLKLPTIQIVRRNDKGLDVVAEYSWSKEDQSWSGPQGSVEEGFLRIEGDSNNYAPKLNKLMENKPNIATPRRPSD